MSAGLATSLRHRDGATLLCLDYLHYARRMFGAGEKRWIDGVQLLNLFRQAQQGVQADVILFPLLDWMVAWRDQNPVAAPATGSSIKALRIACTDANMLAALRDVIAALATLNGSKTSLALSIDDPARWLAWAGGTQKSCDVLEQADAEDVAVYLSALLHQLSMSDVGALFMRQDSMLDGDLGQAYEPLTNTARHYGLPSVLCAAQLDSAPDGFDSYATRAPMAVAGHILSDDAWSHPQALPAVSAFALGVIPEAAKPEKVLAALKCWRLDQA